MNRTESLPDNPSKFSTSLKLLKDGKQLAICHMGFRFDSYSGWCGHNCSYCYARGIETRFKRWGPEKIKIADLNQIAGTFRRAVETDKLDDDIVRHCIRHRYPIRMGTNTDCFQPAEEQYRISYRFITEIMNQYGYPYSICTKSNLVTNTEYMKIYGDNVAFQITLSTLKQHLLNKIEAGAPTSESRLKAVKVLSDAGFFVGCRISPYIPEYMDDLEILVERLAEAGCRHVTSDLLWISPNLNKVMIEDCGFDVAGHYRQMGAKCNIGYFRYPLARKIEYQCHLKELCDRFGMTFATCAEEDPSFHTVRNCCGYDSIPAFSGCPTATYETAFMLCKEKGTVSFMDLLKSGWSPDPVGLKAVWDKGYFENILMNLEFEPSTKTYRYVECNRTMRRVNR